jgi:hypothetical protein
MTRAKGKARATKLAAQAASPSYRLTAKAARETDYEAIMKAIHTLQGAGLMVWKETTDIRGFHAGPITGWVPTVQVKLIDIPSLELIVPRGGILDWDDELGLKELYAQVTKQATAAGA